MFVNQRRGIAEREHSIIALNRFVGAPLAERSLINQTVRKLIRKDLNRIEVMQNQERIKGLKLVAILLVTGVVFLSHLQTIAGAQDQPPRMFEIAGMSVPLEQRIGVDDGAAFVVHFGGDTRGTLEACG